MKYILILALLFCMGCKKEQTTPTETKSKTPYYLEVDSTTDNQHQHE